MLDYNSAEIDCIFSACADRGKEDAADNNRCMIEPYMEEKDRHIVTFGDDLDIDYDAPQDVVPEVIPHEQVPQEHAAPAEDRYTVVEPYTLDDLGASVAAPADADPVQEAVAADTAADTDNVPVDAAAEDPMQIDQTVSDQPDYPQQDEYLRARSEQYPQQDAYQSAETDTAYSQADDRPADSSSQSYGLGHDAAPAYSYDYDNTESLYSGSTRDKRYVTKSALAICMIITMLVSSVLGALFGSMFSRGSSSDGGSASDPSELSQLSLSDATGSELTISEIVSKNEDAVVEILVSGTSQNYFGQMQVTEGAGSGVIINKNGYIVTNYHVIEGANKVQVTLHNGETYPATIIGGDDDNDIAVVKINATDLTIAEFGDSDSVNVGDTAVAIGNPLGQLGGTATTGIISALDRRLTIDGRTLSLLQTDAAINGGNSGGGLFNSKGELIGIVDAKSEGVGIEGLAFAIPVNSVKEIINDLVENGKVSGKPAVGIMIQEVSEENAQYYNLEQAGVYIAQVTGENAQKAGFQTGDRIISINGNKIESSSDFISRVRACKIGDTVSIVVSRSGQEIEIKTVLEELTTNE